MKRRFNPNQPELMDRPQPVSRELERDLANLRSINRWFGSHRLVRFFLRRWFCSNAQARVLDLATGSGDIPRLIADFARQRRVAVQIDAIDQQQATIEIARRLSGKYPEIRFFVADLFEWQADQRYDLVLFSLALHHFSSADAVRALQKCRELSGRYVLVSDLRRAHWLTLAVNLMTAVLYRDKMTKIDARLSAQRAFSFAEMRDLALQAGWRDFGHRRFPIGRQAIWLQQPNENH